MNGQFAIDRQSLEEYLLARAQILSNEALVARISDRAAADIRRQEGRVAVLSVGGVITPRASFLEMFGLGISAERLGHAVRATVADPEVKAVVLDVHSPGGNVMGISEVAADIRAAAMQKPVVAQVNHMALSAAYWAVSGASEIVSTPSGEVGSIGVLTSFTDLSAMLEKAGIRITTIGVPELKADLVGMERSLTEGTRQYLESTTAEAYTVFVKDVATGRKASQQTVREEFGGGAPVGSTKALALGMIDRIGTLSETMSRLGVTTRAPGARSRAMAERRVSLLRLGGGV